MPESDGVRRLILLRHGQTEWNADSRMQGQMDTHLSELGHTQAKQAAAELTRLAPCRVISSDLARAQDTARVLADALGVGVELDPRLRETALGQWQGLTHVDVDEHFPGQRAAWRNDATFAPPGGESRVDVAERTLPVMREILAAPDIGTVVLVAHGGTICALTAALLELPVERWPILGGLGNASWVQLSGRYEDAGIRWRLDVWNASAQVAPDVL